MYYNVLNLEKEIELDGEKYTKKTLMENAESSLELIAIEKGGIVDTHTAKENSAVYVLDGKIELHFDAQQFVVEKGEMLLFKKDTQHKVLGIKDSKFILIKI